MERQEIRRKLAVNQAALNANDKEAKALRHAVLRPHLPAFHVMRQLINESDNLSYQRRMLERQLEGLGGPETLRERLETWFGAFERSDTAKDQAAKHKASGREERNEAQPGLDQESLAAPLLQKSGR